MVESEDYSVGEEEDGCIWMDSVPGKKGGRNDKKRRFSEEQIKSLESMFESQTKLEPRKKLQLAKELGLHPRQVAIWFQNKRARWKSKQLEREYSALRADYDALLSSFESVKNEKQSLILQLQKLVEMLGKPVEDKGRGDSESLIGIKKEQSSKLRLIDKSDAGHALYADDEDKFSSRFSKKEEDLYTSPLGGSSLVPAEQQFCFQPSWPSEQSATSSQWWEFWPMNE